MALTPALKFGTSWLPGQSYFGNIVIHSEYLRLHNPVRPTPEVREKLLECGDLDVSPTLWDNVPTHVVTAFPAAGLPDAYLAGVSHGLDCRSGRRQVGDKKSGDKSPHSIVVPTGRENAKLQGSVLSCDARGLKLTFNRASHRHTSEHTARAYRALY